MNGNNDFMTCSYCYEKSSPIGTNGHLTRNGASEFSLTGYGAINTSFEDCEYNSKHSDEYDITTALIEVGESLGSTQRSFISIESRMLRPYNAVLKFLGMRAFRGEYCIQKAMSFVWPLILFFLLIAGYIINYAVCQADESQKTDHKKMKDVCANVSLSYIYMDSLCESTLDSILPSVIHFIAFSFTFWIFRIKQSEQVEALIQKCFVTPFFGTNTQAHKKTLNRKITIYSIFCFISLIGLLIMTLTNSYFGKTLVLSRCLQPYLMSPTQTYFSGIGYAIPMFLMHVTYFPILINYILQSHLISFLISEVRETLREKRTTLKVIMQESHDTSSFLHKMNHEAAPAVSLMVFYLFYGFFIDVRVFLAKLTNAGSMQNLWNISKTCDPNRYSNEDCKSVEEVMMFGRVSLISMFVKHFILGLLVFLLIVEGCKVNMNFRKLVNQAMETRVFGFKSACFHELDSLHNYIKSLRMRAKLFQFPLETKNILLPLVVATYIGLCFLLTWV